MPLTLRDAPLPRMAGQLSFLRAPQGGLDDLAPGMVAALGIPLEEARGPGSGRRFAPQAYRETSAYFGSHFNAGMQAAMDIDQRRVLDVRRLSGRVVDLGTLSIDTIPIADAAAQIAAAIAAIAARQAIPLVLGGDAVLLAPMLASLGAVAHVDIGGSARPADPALPTLCIAPQPRCSGGYLPLGPADYTSSHRIVSLHNLRDHPLESAGCAAQLATWAGNDRPLVVSINIAALACQWHGGAGYARFDGLSLPEAAATLRALGRRQIAGIALTGLDPTINGISVVKTGQRLMLTALLELIYASLDVLTPAGATVG